MQTDRKIFLEELQLRKHIRKAIKVVKERKRLNTQQQLSEESKLRGIIRSLLSEAGTPDPEDSPHESTGINYLKDLLKLIIPVIEIDYKKLTTSSEQRQSFRAHVVQAVKNALIPPRITDEAGEEAKFIPVPGINEQIEVEVGEEEPMIPADDRYIDIDDPEPKSEEETEQEEFEIEGEDETGRDAAYSVFKKIEGNILDSWEILSSDEDKNLFFDYLITNLKLHFDRFEDELARTIPEPTTDEYEKQSQAVETPEEVPLPSPEEIPPSAPLPPMAE